MNSENTMKILHAATFASLSLLLAATAACQTTQDKPSLAAARARLYVKHITRVPYKIRASLQNAVDTTAKKTTTLDSNWNIVEKDSQKIVVSSPSGRQRTFDRKVTSTNPDLKAVLVSSVDAQTRTVAIDNIVSFAGEKYVVFDIRPRDLTVILMRKRDHGRVVVRRRGSIRSN